MWEEIEGELLRIYKGYMCIGRYALKRMRLALDQGKALRVFSFRFLWKRRNLRLVSSLWAGVSLIRERGSAGMSCVCIHEHEIFMSNLLHCVRIALSILQTDGVLERSFLSAMRTELLSVM